MTAIAPDPRTALPARTNPGRAAWREEMLGEFLQKMRDHKPQEEPIAPVAPLGAAIKGQYVDVYG
jgi:hypothetical protein